MGKYGQLVGLFMGHSGAKRSPRGVDDPRGGFLVVHHPLGSDHLLCDLWGWQKWILQPQIRDACSTEGFGCGLWVMSCF